MIVSFKAYLCNRKKYVSVKNSSSSKSNITLGVLQGSVLGPVLFLLSINDMHRSSDQLRFVHFADDTTVFASNSDINNVHASLNRELVGVDNWFRKDGLVDGGILSVTIYSNLFPSGQPL